MYAAETSSNPTPSETAKVMGPYMMNRAEIWFYAGVGFIVLILILGTVVLNKVVAKKALKLSEPAHQDDREFGT